jgi:hypothetical protein
MKTGIFNKHSIIILCLGVILFLAMAMSAFAEPRLSISLTDATPTPDFSKQEKIDKLLDAYQQALDYEVQNGETIEVQDPEEGTTRELTGESKTKIEELWQSTVQQINELSARPVEERAKAVQMIQSIEPGDVVYLDRDRTPYDMSVSLERYQTAQFIYSVDIATNQIIEIVREDEWNINVDPIFSSKELEAKGREFISIVAKDTNLDVLTPSFGNKSGEMFFFKWEDHSRFLSGKITPFILIGFSQGGDLLNYVNTLSLSATISSTFDEYYANGGSYWQWLQGSYTTKNNAGYCYIYGWCSPKNFYYQNTCYGCVSAKGRWKPNTNPTVKAKAFVPSTHATTRMACYKSYYNGGTTMYEKCINQNIYYDEMVSITSASLYNIRRIDLSNQSDSSTTKEIAWDETYVYTP